MAIFPIPIPRINRESNLLSPIRQTPLAQEIGLVTEPVIKGAHNQVEAYTNGNDSEKCVTAEASDCSSYTNEPSKGENMNVTSTSLSILFIVAAFAMPIGMALGTIFIEIVMSSRIGIAGQLHVLGKNKWKKV
jgi:hypothetical protein